jgi:hypothetical protein
MQPLPKRHVRMHQARVGGFNSPINAYGRTARTPGCLNCIGPRTICVQV